MPAERSAWLRQDGESNFWFGRFTQFDQLGPSRSLSAVYRAERTEGARTASLGLDPCHARAPGSWKKAAARWSWTARAEAHDAELQGQSLAEYEAERIQERDRRITLLKAYRGRIITALNDLEPSAWDPFTITAAIKLVTEQLRKEYNDEPATRVEHSGQVSTDIPVRVIDYRDGLIRLRPPEWDEEIDRP